MSSLVVPSGGGLNPSPTIEEVWNSGSFATSISGYNANTLVEEKTLTINGSGNSYTIPAQTLEIDLGDGILTDAYHIDTRLFSFSGNYIQGSTNKALKGKFQINDIVVPFNTGAISSGYVGLFGYNINTKSIQYGALANNVIETFAGWWGRIKKIKFTLDETVTFTLNSNSTVTKGGIKLYRKTLFL